MCCFFSSVSPNTVSNKRNPKSNSLNWTENDMVELKHKTQVTRNEKNRKTIDEEVDADLLRKSTSEINDSH